MELNLEEEVKKLKEENELLKQRLNNYSASYKKYYESNKEIINEKKRERQKLYYQQNKELIKQKQKEIYENKKLKN
jgi:hypothetical protein